jgi:transposase
MAVERGRPKKAEIELSEQEHASLQVMAHSRSLPHSVVRRAQMILMSAEGYANTTIAGHFGLTLPSVDYWRKRYLSQGIAGLYDISRPGRPYSYDDDSVATLLNKVLKEKPRQATHWTVRLVAEETGIPKSSVQRYLHLFGVQPYRSKSFKLSTDPFFVEKVRDIVA